MKQIVHDVRDGAVQVMDVPAPTAGPGEVLIHVRHSLVSAGTERTVVEFAESSLLGKARRRPDLVAQVFDKVKRDGIVPAWEAVTSRLRQPLALGYAVSGTVVDVGYGVEHVAPGDPVAAAGAGHAVHAEMVTVPKNLVVKLPAGVDFEAGCFTTLGAIALQGVRVADVKLGECVAVIGLGLLGNITVQLLRAAGCRVVAFDPRADRAELAQACGAEAVAYTEESFDAICRTTTSGRGVDAVLITAGARDSGPLAMAGRIARDKGVVVAVGAIGMNIPRKPFYDKELELRLSRSYGPGRYDRRYEEEGHDYPFGYVRWTEGRNMEAFVQFLAQATVDVRPLVTHRFPVDAAEEAYKVLGGRDGEPALGIVVQYPATDPGLLARHVRVRDDAPAAPASPAAGPVETVRCGVVGAGAFAGRILIPALRKAGAQMAGVCARSGVSARHAADAFGFDYCATETSALLADPSIGSIVIASPHHLHAAQVVEALEAGRHVFVEKPLCLTEEELRSIEDAHRRAGRILMVGFNRRFAPLALEMKRFAAAVTEPLFVHYRVNAGFIPPDHWVQDPARGGGRLIGEGVHFIDFVSWLVGAMPTGIEARALPDGGRYTKDNFTLTLQFANGSLAQIDYLANGHRALGKERIEMHGGGHSAVLEDFRSLRLMGGRTSSSRLWLGADKGHAAECRAFVNAVRADGAAPIPFADIAAVMRAAFLAHAQLSPAARAVVGGR